MNKFQQELFWPSVFFKVLGDIIILTNILYCGSKNKNIIQESVFYLRVLKLASKKFKLE